MLGEPLPTWSSVMLWVLVALAVLAALVVRFSLGGTSGWFAGVGVFLLVVTVPTALVLAVYLRSATGRYLNAALDPSAAPPDDAVRQPLALADRWQAATRQSMPELLAEDFVDYPLDHPPVSRAEALRLLRAAEVVNRRTSATVRESLIRPSDPTTAWVRIDYTERPWIGRPLHATWWEVWTMTADCRRLRSRRVAAVTDVHRAPGKDAPDH